MLNLQEEGTAPPPAQLPTLIGNIPRNFFTKGMLMIRNHRGAALVELAIILPLLFVIVLGIFEFGRAMLIVNTLNHAAREGARQATTSPAPININAIVNDCIPFPHAGLTITTSNVNPAPGSGIPITVIATLPFEPVTGLIPFPDGFTLTGQATMRYEM